MFTFDIIKRLGEGSYLNDDLFIIERVRRERALNNMRHVRLETKRVRAKAPLTGYGKTKPS